MTARRTLLALLPALAADAAGGDNLVLLDAGPVARLGAPIAATLADLAGALTIGGAVVAGWLLRERTDRARALGIVAGAAAVTTLQTSASLTDAINAINEIIQNLKAAGLMST